LCENYANVAKKESSGRGELTMTYEIRVSEIAQEFGVHRNTIRNWINSGILPVQKGPGRRYLIQWEDYLHLCVKYGREPRHRPEKPGSEQVESKSVAPVVSQPVTPLSYEHGSLFSDSSWIASCLTCGSCAGVCPISGVDDLDPRKIIRMTLFGLNESLLVSDWPWKCTLCAKCEEACPMNIEIVQLMLGLRSHRKRSEVPGSIYRGVVTCLEKGNNLGIPKDDILALLEGLGVELEKESCPGFRTQIDVRGARLLVPISSKIAFSEPDALKWWWKIFHAVGESWTIAGENWDGTNYGFFSGDDDAMKTIVGKMIDNMERLGCQALLLPECGHSYHATRYGLTKWFPEFLQKYKIYTVFDLLLEYIQDKQISLNADLHIKLTTYHDPCHYGRKSLKVFGHGYFNEAREIIRACCHNFIEMVPNRNGNYCCGAGGGSWSMPFAAERTYHGRIKADQIRATGAEMVIASCHSCRDQLKNNLNREFDLGVEVKYLWELVADSLIPTT